MNLKDLEKKEEPKIVTVYNYYRSGEVFTTPNVKIAIARCNGEEQIQVGTHTGHDVEYSVLVLE